MWCRSLPVTPRLDDSACRSCRSTGHEPGLSVAHVVTRKYPVLAASIQSRAIPACRPSHEDAALAGTSRTPSGRPDSPGTPRYHLWYLGGYRTGDADDRRNGMTKPLWAQPACDPDLPADLQLLIVRSRPASHAPATSNARPWAPRRWRQQRDLDRHSDKIIFPHDLHGTDRLLLARAQNAVDTILGSEVREAGLLEAESGPAAARMGDRLHQPGADQSACAAFR